MGVDVAMGEVQCFREGVAVGGVVGELLEDAAFGLWNEPHHFVCADRIEESNRIENSDRSV